jgi:hypothetical protein
MNPVPKTGIMTEVLTFWEKREAVPREDVNNAS